MYYSTTNNPRQCTTVQLTILGNVLKYNWQSSTMYYSTIENLRNCTTVQLKILDNALQYNWQSSSMYHSKTDKNNFVYKYCQIPSSSTTQKICTSTIECVRNHAIRCVDFDRLTKNHTIPYNTSGGHASAIASSIAVNRYDRLLSGQERGHTHAPHSTTVAVVYSYARHKKIPYY